MECSCVFASSSSTSPCRSAASATSRQSPTPKAARPKSGGTGPSVASRARRPVPLLHRAKRAQINSYPKLGERDTGPRSAQVKTTANLCTGVLKIG